MLSRLTDRALRASSRLLASERVFGAVQVGLSFTLSARKQVDRALDELWAALNVVSYRDVERLERQLAEAEATIEALEARLAERAGGGDDAGSR